MRKLTICIMMRLNHKQIRTMDNETYCFHDVKGTHNSTYTVSTSSHQNAVDHIWYLSFFVRRVKSPNSLLSLFDGNV